MPSVHFHCWTSSLIVIEGCCRYDPAFALTRNLFDLGRVVIDIDFDKALTCWAGQAGCEPAHLVGRFARDEIYQRHETGSIDDAEFFASLRTSLGIDLSDAQFLEGWNAIFAGEMPGIGSLLTRARMRVPLYAFSNTNSAHVKHFSQAYHYSCRFLR